MRMVVPVAPAGPISFATPLLANCGAGSLAPPAQGFLEVRGIDGLLHAAALAVHAPRDQVCDKTEQTR